MSTEFLKPNLWNSTLTIISSVLYYSFTFLSITNKCLLVADKVYRSYSFLFGTCGQTSSPTYSILSILISLLFIPIVYIVFSSIVNLFRNR